MSFKSRAIYSSTAKNFLSMKWRIACCVGPDSSEVRIRARASFILESFRAWACNLILANCFMVLDRKTRHTLTLKHAKQLDFKIDSGITIITKITTTEMMKIVRIIMKIEI